MKTPTPPPNAATSAVALHSKIENRQSKIFPGLRCPRCGCSNLPVYYTRAQSNHILRVRRCYNCGRKLVTREIVA